jgi:hypothetical protein
MTATKSGADNASDLLYRWCCRVVVLFLHAHDAAPAAAASLSFSPLLLNYGLLLHHRRRCPLSLSFSLSLNYGLLLHHCRLRSLSLFLSLLWFIVASALSLATLPPIVALFLLL